MYMIGVRFWNGTEMIYPTLFSVMTNFEERKSSLRAYIEKKKHDTQDYMLLTPGVAINGEIYEQDIICEIGSDKQGIVKFNPEKGAFIAEIDGKDIYIGGQLFNYEILGNTYEGKENSEVKPLEKEQDNNNNNVLEQTIENEKNKEDKKSEIKEECLKKENIELNKIKIENNTELNQKDKEEVNIQPKKIVKITPIENEPIIEVNRPTAKLFGDHIYVQNKEDISVHDSKGEIKSQEKQGDKLNETTFFEEKEIKEESIQPKTIEDIIDIQEEPKLKIFFKEEFYPEYEIGKYGFIVKSDNFHKSIINQVTDTTENRVQLIMLIDALRMFKKKCEITIICNEKYPLYPFINSWIDTWANNKWVSSSGNEVRNRDLWEKLYELSQKHKLKWNYDININKHAEYRMLEENFIKKTSTED